MKYILGVLGAIILLIMAVVLITSSGSRGSEQQQGERQVHLNDYIDTDAVVSWTEQGELVGEDKHKEVRIVVSRSERRIELLTGYDGKIERNQNFSNSGEAFSRFVRALDELGFSRKKATKQPDYRGVCPLGRRYIYTLHRGNSDDLFLWSTSCSKNDGTFGGRSGPIRELFRNQISTYNEFIRGVRL
jgi:hypothetical protein